MMRSAADRRTRTSRWIHRAALATALAVALAIWPQAPARAGDLDKALEAGTIGEQYDGYLGIIEPPGSSKTQKLVESTNAKRKKKYSEIGKENGLSTSAVAAQMAAKLAKRAKSGSYLMSKDGDWSKKK
jgi:uncharacterized protein YdbL (DUF1318 family)